MSAQTISRDGTDLVKAFESCLKPVSGRKGFFTTYICPAGVLTIAWGHTNDHGRRFKAGEVWSQAECDAALAQDLATFETSVSTILKDVPLAQHEYDALVSLSYNIGPLTRSSIPAKLKAGRKAEVRAVMARWNKGGGKVLPGLTRRREAEADLFEGKIDEALRTAGVVRAAPLPMPQQVDTPKPPLTVVAKGTKRETAAVAAGGTLATGSGTSEPHPFNSALTVAGIALGLALVAAAGVLLVRKYKLIAEEWR
ncbi:lysozyme [Azorhizobium sp. AG788]|uniref:lysozyme n=1 Tax=Azorhizobium sp. AG788 TaxID=2183897 RepID=UPI00313A2486